MAIFGAVLANSYSSEFATRFTEADRALVGPAIVTQLEDPTIRLNERQFKALEANVTALPGGPDVLARAKAAQGSSIASAIRLIYTGAFIACILSIAFALALREIPLRRSQAPGAGAKSQLPPAAAVPPEASPGGGAS